MKAWRISCEAAPFSLFELSFIVSGILLVRESHSTDQYICARILLINDQLGRQSEISRLGDGLH
jgi:hypothetical protein